MGTAYPAIDNARRCQYSSLLAPGEADSGRYIAVEGSIRPNLYPILAIQIDSGVASPPVNGLFAVQTPSFIDPSNGGDPIANPVRRAGPNQGLNNR